MKSNELYHHGVKGMKWGVRKQVYKSMNKTQRKNQKFSYKIDQQYSKYKNNNRKIEDVIRSQKNKNKMSSYSVQKMNNLEYKTSTYRDSSKRMITKISKTNPKLANALSKKYSDLLDKVTINDFTVSELEMISKHPDALNNKAKKYTEQFRYQRMSELDVKQKAKQEVNSRYMMRQQINQQITQQIHQQIHQQITQQIHQQNMMAIGMM